MQYEIDSSNEEGDLLTNKTYGPAYGTDCTPNGQIQSFPK